MTGKNTLVSVIVPTYNRAGMISRTLESIFRQSYDPIQILVVDDGSTDGTKGVVESLANHPRKTLHYIHKENGGCASARNVGLDRSSGEFIAFLDDDDCWVENAVGLLAATLMETRADFVYSPCIEVYQDGREEVNLPVAAGRPDDFKALHFLNTNLRPGSYLFRRSLLATVGRVDESLRYNEDSDFVQRLAIVAKAAYQPIPTLRYNHHEGNKSRNRVAIYKALLKSTENILAAYPDFAATLGPSADARIREIRTLLFESLIQKKDFGEARRVAEYLPEGKDRLCRAAFFLRSRKLLRFARKHLGPR